MFLHGVDRETFKCNYTKILIKSNKSTYLNTLFNMFYVALFVPGLFLNMITSIAVSQAVAYPIELLDSERWDIG
jgi:hypothetical protein